MEKWKDGDDGGRRNHRGEVKGRKDKWIERLNKFQENKLRDGGMVGQEIK